MEETRPIGTVDETVECVCLKWSTVDEVDHSQTQSWKIEAIRSRCRRIVWDGAGENYTKLHKSAESK